MPLHNGSLITSLKGMLAWVALELHRQALSLEVGKAASQHRVPSGCLQACGMGSG